MRIRVVETADDLADLSAIFVARELRRLAEADPGRPLTLGLSGGSTPRIMYRRLVEEDVPWERVHAFLGDERWVDVTHEDSNARMAAEALFDHVPATLHLVSAGVGSPAEKAAAYEAELQSFVAAGPAGIEPDLVLLGLGPDGHTASLFPNTEALVATDRDYVANWVPQLDEWRLTATLPLLHRSGHIVFLATGESKADIVAQILETDAGFPARLVLDGAANITWFMDKAAGSLLTSTEREIV